MRAFVLRELRRQAVPAAGAFVLGLLVFGLPLVLASASTATAAAIAAVAVTLAAPWLVGVGAVAPDAETRAAAFLATLPVAPWKLHAARLLVAAGHCAATLVLFGSLMLLLVGEGAAGGEGNVFRDGSHAAALALLVFGAAVLASVLAPNTLAALLVTPLALAASVAASFALPQLLLGGAALPDGAHVGIGVVALLAAGSAAAARADAHRAVLRPAFTAAAALVIVPALAGAGAAACDRLAGSWRFQASDAFVDASGAAVVPSAWAPPLGLSEGWRWQVVAPDATRTFLPEGHWAIAVAPGAPVVLCASGDELVLWDREAVPEVGAAPRARMLADPRWFRRPPGWRTIRVAPGGPPVAWRDRTPFFFAEPTRLDSWDGDETLAAPEGWEVRDLAGGRALLQRGLELAIWALDGGEVTPLEGGPGSGAGPAPPGEAAASEATLERVALLEPAGAVVAFVRRGAGGDLWGWRLERPRHPVRLLTIAHLDRPERDRGLADLTVAVVGGHAFVAGEVLPVRQVSLATGREVPLRLFERSPWGGLVATAPAGDRALLFGGQRVLEVEPDGAARLWLVEGAQGLAFLPDGRLLGVDPAGELVVLEEGAEPTSWPQRR